MSVQATGIDISHLLERYPSHEGQEALIGLLQDIQEEVGYLPVEALETVSRHLKVPLSHIYGVTSFYTQFSLTPRGKYVIRACTGTACHIRGGMTVLDEIKLSLNINDNETTVDGQFTLETVRCVGACALAPVIVIGEKYYGALTPAKVRKLLAGFKEAK